MLGVPLTHLNHLSALLQDSSVEPSAISVSLHTPEQFQDTQEQQHGNRLIDCELQVIYLDWDDVSGTDNMCYTLIGLAWLHWCLWMCQSLIYVSFSDMMQGDNGNIKEVLGITLLIDYLAIYLIYCCIIVFCLYNETVLYNTITEHGD